MARPIKKRRICAMPRVNEFYPITNNKTEQIEITVDEYESIRLIDYLNFSQEDCANQMNVARTTVQSIYDTARKKIATALVEGKTLKIIGGSYDICSKGKNCCGKDCCNRNCKNENCENENCKCSCCHKSK